MEIAGFVGLLLLVAVVVDVVVGVNGEEDLAEGEVEVLRGCWN